MIGRYCRTGVILPSAETELEQVRGKLPWSKGRNPGQVEPRFLDLDYTDIPRFLQFKDARQQAFIELREIGRSRIKRNALMGQVPEYWYSCLLKITVDLNDKLFSNPPVPIG